MIAASRIAALAALGCAWLVSFPGVADEKRDCDLKPAAILAMKESQSGAVSVPLTIDGRRFELTVDTGDYVTVLSENVAGILQKKPRPSALRARFLGDVTLDTYIVTDTFMLDHLVARNLAALVAPQRLLGESDGLLGPDIMSNYDVDFDFARSRMIFFDPYPCKGWAVYWTRNYGEVPIRVSDDYNIFVEVTIDGKTLDAILDTGADKSTLSLAAAKSIFGLEPNSAGMVRRDHVRVNGGNESESYRYPFSSLAFSDVAVVHPDIDIVDEPGYMTRDAPLLIGINVLRQLHMYVAYKERILYVTPAEAH
jgi:predicted aspartyl protease